MRDRAWKRKLKAEHKKRERQLERLVQLRDEIIRTKDAELDAMSNWWQQVVDKYGEITVYTKQDPPEIDVSYVQREDGSSAITFKRAED